nr:toprim domain-containing protein [Pseudomonas luteola]
MNVSKTCQLAGAAPLCLEKVEIAFRDALQNVYGALDWLPVADGAIHRFRVPSDRPGALNGWYVLYLDGIASGAFGSWKVGEVHRWSIRKPTDPLETQLIAQRIEQAKRQREAELQKRWLDAEEWANRWWHESRPADPEHPYLMRKQVKPHGLRQRGSELLVPLYHSLQLVNLQRIAPDGSKRFLAGGRVKGSYSPLGGMGEDQTLYICEGWATGATLREATGSAVACAMNAGNLLEVALQLKHRYPAARLVIAGDDDRQTPGNPGRTAANAAALAVGAEVVFPDWPEDAPLALSDFNDLSCWSARHE